jgi:hypothetical protein
MMKKVVALVVAPCKTKGSYKRALFIFIRFWKRTYNNKKSIKRGDKNV